MAKPSAFVLALTLMAAVCCLVPGVQNSNASSQPQTGIEGSISISPVRGGPSIQGVSDSAPLVNTRFLVENAAGLVVTFRTDDHGRFRIPLPPGRYTVRTTEMKTKGGKCGPFEVEVEAAGFKKVKYDCDSGMR
jgi:hypothetical protein